MQNKELHRRIRRGGHKNRKRKGIDQPTSTEQKNYSNNIKSGINVGVPLCSPYSSGNSKMEIRIKMNANKIMTLYVNSNDKVLQIMCQIADNTGIPVQHQRLLFHNKELTDIYNKTLSQYKITNKSRIHLLLKQQKKITNKPLSNKISSNKITSYTEHDEATKNKIKNKGNMGLDEINTLRQQLINKNKEIEEYKEVSEKYENLKRMIGCENIWQYKNNYDNTWIDYDGLTSDNIEKFDVDDMFEWKQQILQIVNKSESTATILNTDTGETLKNRRIKKLKDVVARDEVIIRDNFIEQQKRELQELDNSYKKKMEIMATQNETLKQLVEKLQGQKATREEEMKLMDFRVKALEQELLNTKYEKERFRLDAARQQKQKWNKKYEIINRDKMIKTLKTEKEKFKLKAEEEQKQKMTKEMEYQQLKEKVEFSIIWQWKDNDKIWKPYDKEISTIIEDLEVNGEYEYTYWVNQQSYKIRKLSDDKAIQINTKTNVERKVRRNEIDSGLLYVKYPECWDVKYMMESNYATPNLIDLTPNLINLTSNVVHSKAQEVIDRFFESVDVNKYEVIRIEAVQNQMLYDKYWSERQSMIKVIGEENLNERDLFHGTKNENVMKLIQTEGFRKEFNNTAVYGKGTYFAKNANYSIWYSSRNYRGIYKMFQSRVICGECILGNHQYELTNWPKKQNGLIYDCLVNNTWNPEIFVIHQNVRAYPMYVIHFRETK